MADLRISSSSSSSRGSLWAGDQYELVMTLRGEVAASALRSPAARRWTKSGLTTPAPDPA